MMQEKKTICPLDCPDSCGMVAKLENGVITSLQGDPDHPFTRGFLCRKMRHYHHRIYSEDRILYPQVRVGSKGGGEFRKISWDEAWEILVNRLGQIREKYGGEALLPFSYAGNMGIINRAAGYPFFNRFGASRLNQTICSSAAKAGWTAHCGNLPGSRPEKASAAKLIIVWGINVKATNIHFWPLIQKSRRSGGKLVVIDPYRNITGKAADYYFPVKPAGDAALALGALKVVLHDKQEDVGFIQDQTSGFTEFAAYVKGLSWQELEQQSGLSKERITDLAALLSQNPETFIRIGVGLSRNTRGAMAVRAIVCLGMALGLLDGGDGRGILLFTGAFNGDAEKVNYSELAEQPLRMINMLQLGQALTELTPPVKSLFVYNSNPLSVAPDASMVRKGLAREDLFTVVHEQVLTPTARYADLLLPATTSFENTDLYTAYGHNYLSLTKPVIEKRGQAISNFELFQTMAKKMGYTDPAFQQTITDRIYDYLEDMSGLPDGLHPEEIKTGEYVESSLTISPASKNTGSGPGKQVRFHFSHQFQNPNISTFPSLIPAREFDDPDLKSRFPLRLITPPNTRLLNSTFGDRHQGQIGTVLINPEDAGPREINSGDRVKIFNHRGVTIRKAKVTDDTQKGLLVAEGIFWEIPQSNVSGINDLTSQNLTDLGEGGIFHESLINVQPVGKSIIK